MTAAVDAPIDLQALTIEGRKSIGEIGEEILAKIAATARGELTRAEDLGHFEFHI